MPETARWPSATIGSCRGVSDVLFKIERNGVALPQNHRADDFLSVTANEILDFGLVVWRTDEVWRQLPEIVAHGYSRDDLREHLEWELQEAAGEDVDLASKI